MVAPARIVLVFLAPGVVHPAARGVAQCGHRGYELCLRVLILGSRRRCCESCLRSVYCAPMDVQFTMAWRMRIIAAVAVPLGGSTEGVDEMVA